MLVLVIRAHGCEQQYVGQPLEAASSAPLAPRPPRSDRWTASEAPGCRSARPMCCPMAGCPLFLGGPARTPQSPPKRALQLCEVSLRQLRKKPGKNAQSRRAAKAAAVGVWWVSWLTQHTPHYSPQDTWKNYVTDRRTTAGRAVDGRGQRDRTSQAKCVVRHTPEVLGGVCRTRSRNMRPRVTAKPAPLSAFETGAEFRTCVARENARRFVHARVPF